MIRFSVIAAAAALSLQAPSALSAAQEAGPKAADQREVSIGTLIGKVPGKWQSQPPAGQFRVAQLIIPKAEGDQTPAMLIGFHFGKNGGGGVDENFKRWMGMVRQPDGRDSEKAARRDLKRQGTLRIHTLDLSGTYLERPFPASQQVTERPNYRMLAAIVETTGPGGDGPYYLRLVGPAKTVAAAKPGWDALLQSLRGG